MASHRIYKMSFARVYPEYVAKAERKGRTRTEVDEIIRWLTGYGQDALEAQIANETDFETFFAEAPHLNPSRTLIKGVICGVRVENIEEPTMREIRYLDKLIDELAKGRRWTKSCGSRDLQWRIPRRFRSAAFLLIIGTDLSGNQRHDDLAQSLEVL